MFVLKLEYMNENKLQQDHPCVIEIIRRFYINGPAHAGAPLILANPDEIDPSAGQVTAIIKHLKQRKVCFLFFFIFCSEKLFFKNTIT